MKTITLTRPITIKPDTLSEPTKYVVTKDLGKDFAVTLGGNWRGGKFSDRFDGECPWPSIVVECNYLSAGVNVLRCDNGDFGPMRVTESRGQAFRFDSCRQSQFQSIRAHRCQSDDTIIEIAGVPNLDSSNMLTFGQVSAFGCDAPTTMQISGTSKNVSRLITIQQLCLHVVWARMQEQFPATKAFNPRKRVHLDLTDSAAVQISNANFRLDPDDHAGSKAIVSLPSSRDNVISSGQILWRRMGEDLRPLIDGPVVVFPNRK